MDENTGMDEDGVIIAPPKGQPAPAGDDGTAPQNAPVQPAEPEPDSQAEEEEERVFDISPDLNISPGWTNAPEPSLSQPAGPKTAPANPQPKKIGEAYGILAERQTESTAPQMPQDLQEAVSTIIPQELRASMADKTVKPSVPPPASSIPPIATTLKWPIPSSTAPVGTPASVPPTPAPATPPSYAPQPRPTPPIPPTASVSPTMTAPQQTMPPSQPSPAVSNGPYVPPAAKIPGIPRPSPTTTYKEPIPAPIAPAAPTPAPTAKISSDPNIKPLRTYESDVADVLSHRNISQASMTIAENKKRGKEETAGAPSIPTMQPIDIAGAIKETSEPTSHSGLKWFLAIFSLILVAGGIFGGYYLYEQSPLAAPVPQAAAPQAPQSIIKTESQTVIAIDGLNPDAIASKVRAEMAKPRSPDSVEEIILAKTENGALVSASPADILSAMSIPAPDMLVRTLQPEWMLGIYADASGAKSLFVIAETDFFQNAFAGMLQWEGTMPFDIQAYLYQQAASTPLHGQFSDHVVKNADVREFTAQDGQVAFLYSFVNDSKLVVAGNEAALSEIQSRLEQQAFMR